MAVHRSFVIREQASEALADLLCHPSGEGRDDIQYGRSYAGTGYLNGSGSAAAAKEGELHWKQLMFFFDM